MNHITTQLRTNLQENIVSPDPTPLQSQSTVRRGDKFMMHFQTINKINHNSLNLPPPSSSHSQKYQQTLQKYSTQQSLVDRIISMTQDNIPTQIVQQKLIQPPMVPNLKSSSRDQIYLISDLFQGIQMKENNQNSLNKLPVIQVYAELLKDIGRNNKAQLNRQLAKSKAIIKTPTYQDLNAPLSGAAPVMTAQKEYSPSAIKEIQTEPQQFQSIPRHPSQKFRRKDLILMEILSQKKRKSYSPDYFTIMELKLMELLDFVLQDEGEYITMEPQTKIKTVLKNLQSFQGKTIQSQSKINLLRIFFQQFTNLKQQKDELQKLKTPMKKLDNKQRFQVPTSISNNKMKETKQTLTATPLRKTTGNTRAKKEKEPQFAWIENSYGHPAKKPMTGGKDQWIGSL